ncbi:LIM and SH3 domain protein F42H10.3-like [Tachypleus tridentatus]|uniref:LIM and SH3 domain protein F42H10.3-like n=1 Tax=Tachypleus tridentatus TaxID=6853 RepID=UPI003FD4E9D5
MSAKKCARCDKTVYPLEELKCLDKIWHKGCFKCQECGMTVNMKTYKGFNKLPYCNVHCPQAKHTAVADTPEIRRLAENTKIQSNIKYHEEFEKQKGKFTQVADDPETLRIRNTHKIISNVAYHGELMKKEEMEQKRHLVPEKNGAPPASSALPPERSQGPPPRIHETSRKQEAKDSPYSSKLQSTVIYTSEEGPVQCVPSRKIGSIADYDPLNESYDNGASGFRSNTTNYSSGAPPSQKSTGWSFRAIYDYTASDVDEVTFMDGDLIVNCTPIDEGWMTGTVERTGQTGMLPANYVEPVN